MPSAGCTAGASRTSQQASCTTGELRESPRWDVFLEVKNAHCWAQCVHLGGARCCAYVHVIPLRCAAIPPRTPAGCCATTPASQPVPPHPRHKSPTRCPPPPPPPHPQPPTPQPTAHTHTHTQAQVAAGAGHPAERVRGGQGGGRHGGAGGQAAGHGGGGDQGGLVGTARVIKVGWLVLRGRSRWGVGTSEWPSSRARGRL